MKGFTLTLSMIIILIFMTTILTIETQKVNIEEQTHSQHAKLRAINSILIDLNSSAFDYSVSRMGKRAMFNVINEEITTKKFISFSAEEEICDEFIENIENYYTNSLGFRLNDSGLTIEVKDVQCEVELVDTFIVNLKTNASLTFNEEGKIEIRKSIKKDVNFSIEGLPDPYLTIQSYYDNKAEDLVVRPILLSPLYNNSENWDDEDLENLKLNSENILYAKGWAYGKLVSYNPSKQDSVKGNILLITSTNVKTQAELIDAINFAQTNGSKAIVLQKSITSVQNTLVNQNVGGCVINYTVETAVDSAPCIKCGTFSKITNIRKPTTCGVTFDCTHFTGLGQCKKEGSVLYFYNGVSPLDYPIYAVGSSFDAGDYVLINEETENEAFPLWKEAKVYDIENQRSATLCGNYFLNTNAPDIFSRMENKTQDDEFGIETFVLGTWVKNDKSKIDYHYYSSSIYDGVKIKGMLACKDAAMCDSNILNIGRFTIFDGDDYLEKYGMEKIEYDG